jgi:Glycosyl hydrolase family 99
MSSDTHQRSGRPPSRRRSAHPAAARVLILALLLSVLLAADAPERATSWPSTPPVGWPIRAAFYYPWFPESENWATRYTPSLGKYHSSDHRVLSAHVAQAQYAGLDAFISSYWGKESPTAHRLPLLLDAAGSQGFHVAIYYEPESWPTPPSSSALSQDFDALHQLTLHPAWLHVDGKPVLFVYNIGKEASCTAVGRLLAANQARFYLNLKVFAGYRDCPAQPDSWHQYVPASGYDQQGSDSASISPGFYKFDEPAPRLDRNLERFQADLARQVASGARWQLVTTFNEWGEGTAVEPSREWESESGHGIYLDALRAAYV